MYDDEDRKGILFNWEKNAMQCGRQLFERLREGKKERREKERERRNYRVIIVLVFSGVGKGVETNMNIRDT